MDTNLIREYLKKNWSAFPVNIAVLMDGADFQKKPIFYGGEWGRWMRERVADDKVEEYWNGFDGVGIATGAISGITVIDIDSKDYNLVNSLPETYTVETNKGFHLYYKYHPGVKQGQGTIKGIDIRNEGGFVFAPPTRYRLPSGVEAEYKIIKTIELADFPMEWYRVQIKQASKNSKVSEWKDKLVNPLEVGRRNIDFASMIGGLLFRFPMSEWEIVWKTIQEKNRAQSNPLPELELRNTFNSIANKERSRRSVGGIIRDVVSDSNEEDIRIRISLNEATVCCRIKNPLSVSTEGDSSVWIEKSSGVGHEIPFHVKDTDTNREQWARILSKAFDRKEDKETYPWTILVAKFVEEFKRVLNSRIRDEILPNIKPVPVSWVFDPFIQKNQINTIFGMGSSGKTLLSLYFASLVADNGNSVMFIDYENDSGSWADKMNKIYRGENRSSFVYYDSEQIPLAEQVDKVKEAIKRRGVSLAIVDSASMASGESTSDEHGSLRLMAALKSLKTTVLLIAHQRKNEGDKNPIGSIQYENQSRNVFNVKCAPDSLDPNTVHIACTHTKSNNTALRSTPLGYKVTFGTTIQIEPEEAKAYFEDKYTIVDRIKMLLLSNGDGLSYKEVADELGITPNNANRNLGIGRTRGLFENREGRWFLI